MGKVNVKTSTDDTGKIRIYSDLTYRSTDYQPKFIEKEQYKALQKNLEKDITESIKSSPELRREIRRVFDIANKRLKRLEQSVNTSDSEIISPAFQSVNRGKFLVSQANGDWNTLVGMYKEAVAFIRQGTSTVRGAKEFTSHVKDKFMDVATAKYQKTEDQLEFLWKDAVTNIKASLDGMSVFADKIRYQQIVQDVYSESVESVSTALERDAIIAQTELEEDIEETSRDLAKEVAATAAKSAEDLVSDFLENWN